MTFPPPPGAELKALLGAGCYAPRQSVRREIEAGYAVAPVWNAGGGNWRYECKYRKGGRTLGALYAREGELGLLLIFGVKERAAFSARREEFSAAVRAAYDDAATYHDGKWVMLSPPALSDRIGLRRLLALKRPPVRAVSPRKSDLQAIPGIGPHIERDLRNIGIDRVAGLAGLDPEALYRRDCAFKGRREDRCQLYVFRLAVYVAEHRTPDPEKLKWWYWKNHEYRPRGREEKDDE